MNYSIKINKIGSSFELNYPLLSFDDTYWMLQELNRCDTTYLISEVLPCLAKVISGELKGFQFGYDATIIDFGKNKSIINYNYFQDKIEVPSVDIYEFISEWAGYLIKWSAERDNNKEKEAKGYTINDYQQRVAQFFSFLLTEYEFSMTHEDNGLYYKHFFSKENMEISLVYDLRDNFFYFKIHVKKNPIGTIKTFSLHDQILKLETGITMSQLQPYDNNWEQPLCRFARYLRKHIKNIIDEP